MKTQPILTRLGRRSRLSLLVAATLAAGTIAQAQLSDGLVSYWPLDDVVGTTTPDLVSGYDLELNNLTAADLVAGQSGNAMMFDNTRQTMLSRVHSPGEQLPINQHPALTISFWANVKGTGLTDLRMFSESSTANNDPLFNIGTASDSASDKVDFFLRRSGWTTIDHVRTDGDPLDGTWRHLVFVQQEDGTRTFYVDGVEDLVGGLLTPKPVGGDTNNWNLNATSIGGIRRANPSHWLTGAIDEVALWSRALSPTEIQQVNSEGLSSVFPPLTRGMVAYWPLDEVLGVTTPDIASGYDLELRNLTAADLVPGKAGQAFQFDNARQTMLARVHSPGEQLPINQHPALTISFWANVNGTGLTDLRMFSESNTGNNNPLFNIGTASDSLSDKVDFYIRQTGWTDVNHVRTDGDPLDGTWRHLVFVQQEDGTRTFYVDAVEDLVGGLLTPKPVGGDTNNWNLNATSIGGILRANPSHWLTGAIDDVALWNRALEPNEITSLFQDGTPVPFTRVQPLAVRSFKADFPAVAVGDSVTLRWDVTKNVKVEIDRIGDVTAQTVAGLGSIEVTLPSTRTFNMTLTRGEETASQALTVYAIDSVAEGWTLIDNFDRYDLGLLNGQGGWGDLDANDFGVIEHEGNKFAAPINGGEGVAVLALGPQTIFEGQQRTLFFRAYLVGDPLDPLGLVNGQVAVTDRRLRFGNEAGDNVGPGALITDADTPTFRFVGGYIGWNPAIRDIGGLDNPELLPDKAWNVWVDFDNGPFQFDNADPPVALNTGDLYSIYVAEEGTAQRITVLSDQIASRNPVGQADTGFTTQDLDRLIIGAIAGHGSLTNLFIDDIYLSKAGYNSTVPRPFGFTTPVVDADPPVMDIQLIGSDISITWDRGVLQSTDAIGGTWAPVAGATSPYTPPIDSAQRFYRASD